MAGRKTTKELALAVVLPPRVDEIPEDELRVAIDDIPVPADSIGLVDTDTTSIEVVADAIAATVEADERQAALLAAETAAAQVPPLPRAHPPRSRYGRRYAGPEERTRRLRIRTRAGRERADLDARIAAPVDGARFIPVVSRQGGVGATTVTAVLGMALADVRTDPVLAVDAHPERGVLADRIGEPASSSVREVARRASRIRSAHELSDLAAHDITGLDVLPSDTGVTQNHPLTAHAYDVVADVAERFYSVVLTDGASGLLEPAMQAALHRADGLVLVSGGSTDDARLAAETIDWLNAHGLHELAAKTVAAVNTATPGTELKQLPQIEAHFRARVRDVVAIPYDEELSAGPIRYGALRPFTRDSARDLAASVIDAAV